jgi:hypothetical protein
MRRAKQKIEKQPHAKELMGGTTHYVLSEMHLTRRANQCQKAIIARSAKINPWGRLQAAAGQVPSSLVDLDQA